MSRCSAPNRVTGPTRARRRSTCSRARSLRRASRGRPAPPALAPGQPSAQRDLPRAAIDEAPDTGQDTITVPLVRLAWARSGDKGDISNIGVIARTPALLALPRAQLTETAVAAWLAHLVKGTVTRFDVPGIHAFNFVCTPALDGGGMASMRNDALGKGMAQILLSMPIQVPPDVLGQLSAVAR